MTTTLPTTVLALSTTAWWAIGYAIAGGVILIAAALLVTIILLARRIATQAQVLTGVLDATRANTQPLFDVASVNHVVQKIVRSIHEVRGESGVQDERTLLQKLRGKLPRVGPL